MNRAEVKGIGPMQFDAVIEIDSQTSLSHVALFARYWVSADEYQIAVVWAEPHGRGLDFSVYPPTLTIRSDSKRFQVNHQLYPVNNCEAEKPIREAGGFTNMFGDYPIGNIRFAEQEAAATRISPSDFAQFRAATNTDGVMNVPIDESFRGERIITNLRIYSHSGQINTIELFAADMPVKRIETEYSNAPDDPLVCRKTTTFSERPIVAILPGQGARIGIRGSQYKVRDIPTTYLKGGRTWTIDYRPVSLQNSTLSLPKRVEVRAGAGNTPLRTAQLGNYQRYTLSPSEYQKAPALFAGFNSSHCAYRALLAKYWRKQPADVSPDDGIKAQRLLAEFKEQNAGETVGTQLRRLNILMELTRILGQTSELERYYLAYLKVLEDNRLPTMLLVGGYNAIDTLVIWGRLNDADQLLGRWLDTVQRASSTEDILRFAQGEMLKGNDWATIKLLQRFSTRTNLPVNCKFEIEAIKSLAARKLQVSFQDPRLKDDAVAEAQARWVTASINTNQLERIRDESRVEALRLFEQIATPTTGQITLKKKIDQTGEQRSSYSVR